MMEAFTAYIKTIAAFTLFGAFSEMLMPDGDFKKYIRLVMGVLLITAALKPILSMMDIEQWNFELLAEKKAFAYSNQEALKDSDYYNQQEKERLMEIYGEELNSRIEEDLTNQFGGNIHVVAQVQQDMEQEDYGSILEVRLEGSCDKGEELKKYMERTYHLEPDAVQIDFDP